VDIVSTGLSVVCYDILRDYTLETSETFTQGAKQKKLGVLIVAGFLVVSIAHTVGILLGSHISISFQLGLCLDALKDLFL
jgi:hypothetical protein